MNPAKQNAITSCGRCGQPEDAHKHRVDTDAADLEVFAALGGTCRQFVVSDAAVIYAKHLTIVDNREPARKPGRIARRSPLCSRCGHRGHRKENCPL